MVDVVATPPIVEAPTLSPEEQRLRGLVTPQKPEEVPTPKIEEKAAAADPELEGEGDEEDDDEGEPKPRKRRRPTFSQLRAEKRAAEAENREMRARLERLEAGDKKPVAQPAPNAEGKPKLENFASYDDYQEALTDWKVDERLKAKEADYTKRSREAKAAEYETGIKDKFNKSVETARSKYEDFDDIAFSDSLKVSRQLAELIGECDEPAEVAYFLGKNPDKAKELAEMSPRRAAVSLGRIEAALGAVTPPPKPVTKASAPVPTIKGGRTGKAKDWKEMSPDEFYHARKAHLNGTGKGA